MASGAGKLPAVNTANMSPATRTVLGNRQRRVAAGQRRRGNQPTGSRLGAPPSVFLARGLQGRPGFSQIVGNHDGLQLDTGVESQKPGLGDAGNLRSVLQVDKQISCSAAVYCREVSCLRF